MEDLHIVSIIRCKSVEDEKMFLVSLINVLAIYFLF